MAKDFKESVENMGKKVKKLGALKLILLVIMVVGTVCSFVFYDYFFGAESVFSTAPTDNGFVNGLWFSIPKLIRAIQIITIVSVIATFVLFLINKFLVKNNREVTVANLLGSIIKWVTVVILVISVLAVWGVDTTALITGAGVITLIVGLGMQSLISDVVAGLFIVFENEFNVGDIVTIDGFRGEVVSIGIRTTKLKALGNIKIFNNSQIKGILNQTVEESTVKSYISIEYGESLARVETVIKNNLPAVTFNGLIGQMTYEGVSELGESGVTLQFSAQCNESDIFEVQRNMNRSLKIMFDDNGITIPFNQLVVYNK